MTQDLKEILKIDLPEENQSVDRTLTEGYKANLGIGKS